MTPATYQSHLSAMSSAMGDEFAAAMDEHKPEIKGMFSVGQWLLVAAVWWAIKKIGSFLMPYILEFLLRRLASWTLEELVDFIWAARAKYGIVSPKGDTEFILPISNSQA